MRAQFKTFLASVAAAAAITVPAVPAEAATQYWIKGRGWGHGIGLSQYGANGFAQAGYTAEQIIPYYYQGTKVRDVAASQRVMRVLLVSNRAETHVRASKANVKVVHGGSTWNLQQGDVVIAKIVNGRKTIYRKRGGKTIKLTSATGVTTVTGPEGGIRTLFTADNGAYGHHYPGQIKFRQVGSRISVVNRVGLERYLRGVVPAEMPSSWHHQALRSQAIVARSYAIATKKTGTYFDAYADTRSQVYRGIEHWHTSTNRAVDGTKHKVAMYNGAVIPAFFFSTSGGRTANIEHVWGGSPRPYLKSVADPYEAKSSPRSPYIVWPEHLAYTPAGLKRRLGNVPGSLLHVRAGVNGSRRAGTVTITGSLGTRTMSAQDMRVKLGLRSTWFRIYKLVINAGRTQVPKGSRVTLRGKAPRAGTTYLVYRNASGGSWVRIAKLSPDTKNNWSRTVRVHQTRVYRLQRGGKLGPGVRVTAT